MNRRARNIFLALGAASFLAMAFGVTLHLHLAHVHDPAHHDCSRCPICHSLLLSKKEYIVEIVPAEFEIDTVGRIVAARPIPPVIQQAFLQQRHSRAPPA